MILGLIYLSFSHKAIATAMKHAGTDIIDNALKYRFTTEKGPFPISQHKLGRGNRPGGRLAQSIRVSLPQIQEGSSTVTMGFGSNVKYFAIHEFGFSGTVGVKAHKRKNGQSVRAHDRILNIIAREPMATELRHSRTQETVMTLARREILKVIDGIGKGGPA